MRLLFLTFLATVTLAHAEGFRVLSFNIRYDRPDPGVRAWTERREVVAAIIRENADLAGLQEVLPNQRQEVMERCAGFEIVGLGREPGDRGESSPVLVRKDRLAVLESGTFWFSDTPDVAGSKSWGNDIPRICTWAKLRALKDDSVVWFFNLHLDHRSQPSREKSTALLLERIKNRAGSEPVIIAGDFNATPENPAIITLSDASTSLRTIYGLAGIPAAGTFHDFTGRPAASAIDFIFLDPAHWKVSRAEILKTTFPASDGSIAWPSDHFPLMAEIELR